MSIHIKKYHSPSKEYSECSYEPKKMWLIMPVIYFLTKRYLDKMTEDQESKYEDDDGDDPIF